jgi:hypothetical protein
VISFTNPIAKSQESVPTPQRHAPLHIERDVWPEGYCTSEQMDLWRQVFEEAGNRARKAKAAILAH